MISAYLIGVPGLPAPWPQRLAAPQPLTAAEEAAADRALAVAKRRIRRAREAHERLHGQVPIEQPALAEHLV